jgi:signal transduction histidine kinase
VTQVRGLSAIQAQRAYPVCIQGVVLHYDAGTSHDLVVQDATGGIYVMGTEQKHFQLHPGHFVELRGVSSAGEYAPIVVDPSVTVLGEAAIPPARPVSFEQLASGSEDGQWVEIQGVVRSAVVANPQYSDRLMVKLATTGGQFTARVLDFDASATNWLVDAEVRVRGICIPIFNRRRQLFNVSLMVPGMADVRVQRAALEDPFSQPVRAINSLLQFRPWTESRHRVKVRGRVALQKPGEYLFIADNTQGLFVRTSVRQRVEIGDVVEVLGFPAPGQYSPTLEDAVFRKVDSSPPPEPVRVNVGQLLSEDHDADLIQVEAQLLQRIRRGNEVVLMLQEERVVFQAFLDLPLTAGLAALPPEGSRIQVTGICQVELQNQRWPQSFRLLLRSPADALMIESPPWWTRRRTLWALALVSLTFLGALGAVMAHSRSKVREQIVARREAEAEFAAVNRERNRLGAELHDSLEQGLTGVALQLEAAQKAFPTAPAVAQRHLDLAGTMVRQSQGEVRRSVRGLRSQMLEDNDLPSALAAIGKQLSEGMDVRIAVATTGLPRRLPDVVENNLLRIAQEATTNALKHSRADNIRVQLIFRPETVTLKVQDDGQGFSPAPNGNGSSPGHFGLADMRERSKRIGGKFSFQSSPGAGTDITVVVPVVSSEQTTPKQP